MPQHCHAAYQLLIHTVIVHLSALHWSGEHIGRRFVEPSVVVAYDTGAPPTTPVAFQTFPGMILVRVKQDHVLGMLQATSHSQYDNIL